MMQAHYLSNLLSRIVTPFFKSGEKYSFEECRISPSNATSLLEVLRGNQIKLIHTTGIPRLTLLMWAPKEKPQKQKPHKLR